MPIECPRCSEIALTKFNTTSLRDAYRVSGYLDEWECSECKHYQTTVNPDYDPTPDEAGEPPLTMEEKMGEPR